jgi:hypothetical protein
MVRDRVPGKEKGKHSPLRLEQLPFGMAIPWQKEVPGRRQRTVKDARPWDSYRIPGKPYASLK